MRHCLMFLFGTAAFGLWTHPSDNMGALDSVGSSNVYCLTGNSHDCLLTSSLQKVERPRILAMK